MFERRPADVIGNAVKIMRIATGDERGDDCANLRKNWPPKQLFAFK